MGYTQWRLFEVFQNIHYLESTIFREKIILKQLSLRGIVVVC